ncbi:hypothetical protein ACYX7E_18590 [Luteimonas sp. RIT-PG2_3]
MAMRKLRRFGDPVKEEVVDVTGRLADAIGPLGLDAMGVVASPAAPSVGGTINRHTVRA